ncbi:penicillin-binding protein activator [Pseudoteredinibacter isoporae]|uniref:penicillin-binding protein activator n=1 Tax=Pseudoteredinibacter isoporae TaxID=570281 RepID=UPI003109D228
MSTFLKNSPRQYPRLGRCRIATVLITSALLSACGSNPSRDQSSYQQAAAHIEQPQQSVAELLKLARTSQARDASQYLLHAAQQLSQQEELSWAQNLLKNVDPMLLNNEDFIEYSLLLGKLSMEDGSYFLAKDTFASPRLATLKPQMQAEQQRRLGELKATLFTLLGDTQAGVEERLQLEQWLEGDQLVGNERALWQTLMMESPDKLQTLANHPQPLLQQGWYELAAIAKNQSDSIEQQQAKVQQWQMANPGHPAAANLPEDLRLLGRLIADQPRKLSLMLPSRGKFARAGKAIRDGFMAAYYQAAENGQQAPQLELIDSSQGDIVQLYQQAVQGGSDLVIGPLDKRQVKRLNDISDLNVPVLAMNYIQAPSSEQQEEYHQQLFQFGLAVEDEARQCAQRAYLEGHRRALVLAPQSSWGNRGTKAFVEEWQRLGGEIVGEQRFTGKGDYSRVIKNSLQLDLSENRYRNLQRILGTNLEFEPRRRQDVDMIFMLANNNQARQVKPTLAFHYASKIPVYATSHIYGGSTASKANRDLNGIRFTALPWLMQEDEGLRQAVDKAAKPSPAYQQLYALGADSFALYPRLSQLAQVQQLQLQGRTGRLQMLHNGQLARQQDWAIMRNGKAQPLENISQR